MTDTEDRAREIVASAGTRIGWPVHEFLDWLEAAIRQYGDERAAAELEACAKVADGWDVGPEASDPIGAGLNRLARKIAAAIRARGE